MIDPVEYLLEIRRIVGSHRLIVASDVCRINKILDRVCTDDGLRLSALASPAEPDTMGEVERLAREHADAAGAHALLAVRAAISPRYEEDAAEASSDAKVELDALLSAVRTIVTERDDARTRAETAEALVRDHAAAAADKRRLAREIDVAMHGEDGAAVQPSLCDLVGPAQDMRRERDALRAQLATLRAEVEGLRKLSEAATPGMWGISSDGGNITDAKGFGIVDAVLGDALHRDWLDHNPDKPWALYPESFREMGDDEAENSLKFAAAAVNFVRTLLSTSGADR